MQLLNAAGFVWDAQDAEWLDMKEKLRLYAAANGGSMSPPRSSAEPTIKRLASWVRHQRHARVKGLLSAERLAQLDAMGFKWVARPKATNAFAADSDQCWRLR